MSSERTSAWNARLGIALVMLFMGFSVKAAECIDLFYFERAPYYQRQADGRIGGLVAGRVRAAFESLGLCGRWEPLPANRHLARVRHATTPVCAVGWFKTPEREKFAKFAGPIYRDRPLVAVARADAGLKDHYAAAAELLKQRKRVLGVRAGFSYGWRLDAEIARWKPPIYTTTRTDRTLLAMLRRKRIDYVLMAHEEADYLLQQDAAGDLVAIDFDDLPQGNRRYLLCGERTPDRALAALNEYFRVRAPR